MTDSQPGRRGSPRRWIRYGFFAWAAFATFWVVGAFRTRGVDPALLAGDAMVSVRRAKGTLAFLPVSPEASTGLVFIVGAGVAPEAYAPLLRPIARMGHPVLVVALPWRIAPLARHKLAAVDRARAIIESEPSAARWVLAGHSLGGALACRIASAPPGRLKALVLIGTSHPKTIDLSGSTLPITKVLGSDDGVATQEMIDANRSLLPTATRLVRIEGGNHSQFGHYGRQLMDGSPGISRERQQEITRTALIEALQD